MPAVEMGEHHGNEATKQGHYEKDTDDEWPLSRVWWTVLDEEIKKTEEHKRRSAA